MINFKTDDTPLAKGDMRIYDNYVPVLDVGDYTITVSQQVNPTTKKGDPLIDETYTQTQEFSVQGPRYTLPAEDLYSVFPPENGQGVFDQFLPHVVLTKKDLPWERNVFDETGRTQQTPWLALLLFVEGEKINGQEALLDPQVDNWDKNRNKSANIQAWDLHHHDTKGSIQWPDMKDEWYETDDFLTNTMCSIIDISPAAFKALFPGKETFQYLAHSRQVNPSQKDEGVLKICEEGWYSIVVGNRLAAPPTSTTDGLKAGKRNIVHLVSLEGFNDVFENGLPADIDRVRMISLKNWSFHCLPDQGESFSALINGLLKDKNENEKPTQFKLDVKIPATTVKETKYTYQAIQNGYVPMRYQTRLGEQTFAWFRGPFSPIPIKNFVGDPFVSGDSKESFSFGTASSAMIYDKTLGIFDVSYGVAWETGRLLALSDKHFGEQLLDWQREGHCLVNRILERKKQQDALQLSPATNDTLTDTLKPKAATDPFIKTLTTQLSSQLIPSERKVAADRENTPSAAYADLPDTPVNAAVVNELLSDDTVRQIVRELGSKELDNITGWLANLGLLNNVPFENLVPHADLLPLESVRFFYVDSNWLDVLIQGALSIGIESSRDQHYQNIMRQVLQSAVRDKMPAIRRKIIGDWASTQPNAVDTVHPGSVCGLLLRSSVVAGWPGLEVNGYSRIKTGNAGETLVEPDFSSHISPLRIERLSGNVLLCLWPDIPAVITIDEPHEGIAFGFEDPPDEKGEGDYLYLRSIDADNYGMPLDESTYYIDAKDGFIDDTTRIVDITGLKDKIGSTLPDHPTLAIRDFAVQMVKVPEQGIFAAKTE